MVLLHIIISDKENKRKRENGVYRIGMEVIWKPEISKLSARKFRNSQIKIKRKRKKEREASTV